MTSRADFYWPLWLFVGFMTLLRLAVAPTFGLGVDEAHYVLYGIHADLSYFDHPPLVGWVHALFANLFGLNALAARLPAIIIGFVTSLFLFRFLLHVTQSRSAALFGVIALNASFMFNALFMMLMPETLLFALIFPILFVTHAIERANSQRDWIGLGILLGLAGLSKYTAILLPLALLLSLLLRRKGAVVITPKIIPSLAIALIIITPVIFWNMEHDWISFAFQANHVAGSSQIDLADFLQSAAAQFGAYSPFLYPVAFYGLYRALRSRSGMLFTSGVVAAVIFVFFAYASLFEKALPHWNALFFLLTLPLGSALLFERMRGWGRYIRYAVGASLLISFYLYSELALKYTPFPDYQSLQRDIYGFDRLMAEANRFVAPGRALAVTNWSLASRALYYNRPYTSELFLIDSRYDQFDLWQHDTPTGRDLVFITTHDFNTNITKKMRCESVVELGRVDITLKHRKVDTATFTLCTDFQGRRP